MLNADWWVKDRAKTHSKTPIDGMPRGSSRRRDVSSPDPDVGTAPREGSPFRQHGASAAGEPWAAGRVPPPPTHSTGVQHSAEHVSGKRQSLSRGFVHLGFVGVVAEIAPNLDVAADASAHLDERLHDHRAAVTDLAQRRPDFVPRQPTFAGNAAIVLASMEMAEQRAGGADRFAEAVLLDVHMERVEHHLDVGLADLANEGDPFLGGVQHMVLKSVEHFQTEVDAEIGGEIREAGNALEASRPVSCLVDRLGIVDRPVGVEGAADDMNIELGEVGQRLLEEGPPRLSDRRIG